MSILCYSAFFYAAKTMWLANNEIHLWWIELSLTLVQQREYLKLLSTDEHDRAFQFHFAHHQQRYIAARGMLRLIAAHYLKQNPHEIEFQYSEYGKPYFAHLNAQRVHFNLAHSDNLAVYAFNLNHPIGIDVEKNQTRFNPLVVERYLSSAEKQELAALPEEQKTLAFYKLWSKKEAMVKAVGKGLLIPFCDFSVSASATTETIYFEKKKWLLQNLSVHQDYQVAIASQPHVEKTSYLQLANREIKFVKDQRVSAIM